MTVLKSASGDDASTVDPTDANDADLRYLEDARDALWMVMSASEAVSGRTAGHEVRALARDALSVQASQLEAILACLLAWGRPEAAVLVQQRLMRCRGFMAQHSTSPSPIG